MKQTPDGTARDTHAFVQTLITCGLTALMLVIYGLVAARVMALQGMEVVSKSLLLVFSLLPPPLCFLLVRVYTQMIEDERTKALTDAWARCEDEFATSEAPERARPSSHEPSTHGAEPDRQAFLECVRHFIMQRHSHLGDLFLGLRKGPGVSVQEMFARDRVMRVSRELARTEIRTDGLSREAYEMPILFFSFVYLAGLLLLLPLFELYGTRPPRTMDLVLTEKIAVPLFVLQAGLLGGGAYAAFNVISRFLSRDIAPRLFLVSGVRLLLAPLGAVLMYMLAPGDTRIPLIDAKLPLADSHAAVVMYLVAGGFPFALLGTLADDLLSRWDAFKKRLMAGKRSTTLVEGMTVFAAQRLSEEGIDVIQHLALCDPADLARRTRYSEAMVADWKDQAILYLLTGDCTLPGTPAPDPKTPPPVLYDLLDQRAGIRHLSGLIRRKLRSEELTFFFARLCEDGLMIDPSLRRIRAAPRGAAGTERP
jgi:hypothetical protein